LHLIEIVVIHLKKIIHEIDERLDVLKSDTYAFEIVTSLMLKFRQFETVYPYVLMVLLFFGCLHLKKSLEKIFKGDVLKGLNLEVELFNSFDRAMLYSFSKRSITQISNAKMVQRAQT